MKPAGGKSNEPMMPRCGVPGCEAWGTFGDGQLHRCRAHLWAGFLPGPDYVLGVLAASSVALDASPSKPSQGGLL